MATDQSRQWPALTAAGVTGVLWASAFVSIRSAGAAYSPGALALGRLLTRTAVLAAISAVRGGGLPLCLLGVAVSRRRAPAAMPVSAGRRS